MTTTLSDPQLEAVAKPFITYGRNFSSFCREGLGYHDMLPIHDELCHFLQHDPHTFKLILMPRYSFKSCIATIGYALWRLSLNDSLRILIYSHSNAKAEGFLTEIKNHIHGMKEGSKFRATYGPWESDPKKGVWNQAAITVAVRQNAHAEPSVDTAGLETGKVGAHYDLIIFDDIVAKENVTTPEQLQKTKDVYRGALSLLRPGGEVLLVGTRWHLFDLYGQLVEENKDGGAVALFIRRAIEDGTYPFERIGLTKQFLDAQRANQGSYMFSALYQNDPVSDANAIFKAKDFAFYEPALRTTDFVRGLYLTCCVDPAISQKEDADDTAITVVGTDPEFNLYLLDVVAGHLLPDQLVDEVFSLHARWGFAVLGLETNAFQKMLRRAIELRYAQERATNPRFRLFHIEEFTGTSATSKDLRIRALQPYHERGALRLPGTKLELLDGPYQKLAEQMVHFPLTQHDDILDSLAYHVPIHRAGLGAQAPPTTIPVTSAAWFERELRKDEVKALARRPRWTRQPLPALSFS